MRLHDDAIVRVCAPLCVRVCACACVPILASSRLVGLPPAPFSISQGRCLDEQISHRAVLGIPDNDLRRLERNAGCNDAVDHRV